MKKQEVNKIVIEEFCILRVFFQFESGKNDRSKLIKFHIKQMVVIRVTI